MYNTNYNRQTKGYRPRGRNSMATGYIPTNTRGNGAGSTPKVMNKSRIVPPVAVHRLLYTSDLTTLSSGTSFVVKSFNANGIFDPDPAILTTGYAGHQWLMLAYEEYLAQTVRSTWRVNNRSESPVSVGINFGFEALDTTIISWQQAKDALEQNFSSKILMCAPKGEAFSNRTVLGNVALQDLVTKGIYQFSEIYSGVQTANPPTIIYVNFIAYSDDGTTSIDLINDITLDTTIQYYTRRPLLDTVTKAVIRDKVVEANGQTLTLLNKVGTVAQYADRFAKPKPT